MKKSLIPTLLFLYMLNTLFSYDTQPNIIFIMADDLGHECIESYGGSSYSTPFINEMAKNGMQFNQAHSQNICTPSRVQVMTGKYNVRNYTRFANLDLSQETFAQGLKDLGYKTCIVGKWQLGGNKETIKKLGFDEHCLWQINGAKEERYVSPILLTNGNSEKFYGQYGPDIQQSFAKSFISKNKNDPFFLYYPITLPHYPFQPTPDSKDWDPKRNPKFNDIKYFKDMVEYLDKLVGDLINHINTEGISKNTLIIFTSDNGTDHRIYSKHNDILVKGAKGKMTNYATHVPFIVNWPAVINTNSYSDALIDFSDIYPTFLEVANFNPKNSEYKNLDGKSIFPILINKNNSIRDHSFCWYMERTDSTNIKSFVQNSRYKLHNDGRFIDKQLDKFETKSIQNHELSEEEIHIKSYFEELSSFYLSLRPDRIPFQNNTPIQIPGLLEFETYDIGMPGVTYKDNTPGNSGAGFWRKDDVDIKSVKGFHYITEGQNGEWLEYSIENHKTKPLFMKLRYSAPNGGIIHFEIDNKLVLPRLLLPKTESSNIEVINIKDSIQLPKGKNILRLVFDGNDINLDSVLFY